MRRARVWRWGLIALTAGLGAAAPAGWAAPGRYALEPGQAHVRVLARSTLHAFEAETDAARGELLFDPDRGELAAPARVTIPVEAMRTGIEARDRAMRRMFEAEQFPDIVVTIEAVHPIAPSRYRLEGRLRIRAIEQPVTFQVEAAVTDEAIEARGRVPLTTAMFALKPPSVLGVIRVSPTLTVDFTSRWVRQP